jgi:hypothetical protein
MDLSQIKSLTLFTDQMVAGGETGRKLAHLRRVEHRGDTDYRTPPTGNSSAYIASAVIVKS